MLDTGADGSLTFNSPTVEKLDLENNLEKVGTSISTDSNGNESRAMIGLIEELVFGKYAFYKVKADLTKDSKGSFSSDEYAGSVGNQLLRKFNIVYDLGNNCLYLKPKLFD